MATLVVEGGATRAAYASGAADALQQAGFVPDAIYGTSAGGAIAAWFAAGQTRVGLRTWDRLADRSLMSFRRLAGGSVPVIDFRRLYGEYYPTLFGLDVVRLRRAPYPVVVTLTDAELVRTEYLDLRRAPDVFRALHATSAMPIVSEAPVELEGRSFVDGGLSDPIPVRRAIEDGHRDLVVLLNRPPGERAAEPRLVTRLVARSFPRLADAMARHHELHNEAVRLAERPPRGVRVRIVRPASDLGIGRFTRDVRRVRAAISRGREDARRALGLAAPPQPPPTGS
jgi:predicted patatin/cPLA2 family phospholipase